MSEKKLGKTTVAYTRQLGLIAFNAISAGKSYAEIASMPDMPNLDVLGHWLDKEPDFQRLVLLARADRAQSLAAEVGAIADSVDVTQPAAVEKARLQCEVRMWLAGELWPSKYGMAK